MANMASMAYVTYMTYTTYTTYMTYTTYTTMLRTNFIRLLKSWGRGASRSAPTPSACHCWAEATMWIESGNRASARALPEETP